MENSFGMIFRHEMWPSPCSYSVVRRVYRAAIR